MSNYLNKKITFLSLIKLTLPTIIMMVFFSISTVIDGVFVSRFVNSNALSSMNIVMPIIYIITGIGVMFATGGSAIVARCMGEDKIKEAREKFSLITLSALVFSAVIAILCFVFIKDVIRILGGTNLLYNDCYSYLSIMLAFTPFMILKLYFDYFLVTAGAPTLGLISSVSGGIINIILDYLFVAKFEMGISGAGLATGIGYVIPSLIGIIFFLQRKNLLHFVKPKFKIEVIKNSCLNGLSEMVTQLSTSITTFLYNMTIIRFLGENGVASITIILYVQMLLNAAYLGFTSGVSPRISYSYGSKDEMQLRKLVKYSYITLLIFALCSFIICRLMSGILISIFTPKNSHIFDITLNGFNIFSYGLLISGFNIFAIGMFTAFSNGKVSAIISLMRTFILFIIGIVILPLILGINGVWLTFPFAEIITLFLSTVFVVNYKSKYMYGNLFN